MDFIPEIATPANQPVEVPYLGLVQYDDKGFLTFPSRNGFDPYRLHVGDFHQYSAEQTEAFLQAWLYFGLICDVLRVPWKQQAFTSINNAGQKVVTCPQLPQYLLEWKQYLRGLDERRRWAALQDAAKSLAEVDTVISNISTVARSNPSGVFPLLPSSERLPLRPEICLSVQVLQSTIARFHSRMQDEYIAGDIPLELGHNMPDMLERFHIAESITIHPQSSRNALIEQRLLESGWCQNDIARMRSTSLFSASTMYYATFFPRKANVFDHTGCSEDQCRQDNINETTYKTKHVSTCSSCQFLQPPMQQLHDIVGRKMIALIRFDETKDDDYKVSVISHLEDEQLSISVRMDGRPKVALHGHYVAFSHVWSHGLGNTKKNALPSCQLRRLQSLANELIAPDDRSAFNSRSSSSSAQQDNVPFWIDTLCVPLEKEYRHQAISKLKETYEAADKILVLDADVEAFSDLTGPIEEKLMRLASSSWMRRMWTLQEAVQARELYARFGGESINIHEIWSKLVDDVRRIDFPYQAIRAEIAFFYRHLFYSTIGSLKPSERLAYVWDTAYYRSTTKSFDKLLVLAGLLGIDTAQLFNLTEAEAFKVIMGSVSVVPKAIAFLDGPRIRQKGCRWMTHGFTKSQLVSGHTLDTGHRTDTGLVFSCPGFVSITAPATLPPSFFILDTESGQWCQALRMRNDEDSDGAWLEVDWEADTLLPPATTEISPTNPFGTPMKFTKTQPLSIILRGGLLSDLSSVAKGIIIETGSRHTTPSQDEPITGIFRTCVNILPEHLRLNFGHAPLPDFDNIWRRHRKREELGLPLIHFKNVILGRAVGEAQKWCVG